MSLSRSVSSSLTRLSSSMRSFVFLLLQPDAQVVHPGHERAELLVVDVPVAFLRPSRFAGLDLDGRLYLLEAVLPLA